MKKKIRNVSDARKEIERIDKACRQMLRGFQLYARHPTGLKMQRYGMRLGNEGSGRALESLGALRAWLK